VVLRVGDMSFGLAVMDMGRMPTADACARIRERCSEFGIDSVDVGETVQANELRAALEGVTTRPYLDALFIYRVQDHAPWANPQIRLGIVKSEAEGFARKQAFWEVQDYLLNHAPSVLCVK